MTSITGGFLIKLEIKGRREREQIYHFCTKTRENTIHQPVPDMQRHRAPPAPAPHSHDTGTVDEVHTSLHQCNPQDCGSCCYVLMFLTFRISELSILKHNALCPLSPRCKPPPCASLWVSVALLCWAACLHPRCTSSFSSPRRTWSLTGSTSTGSASVGPGPLIPSVSSQADTFLWDCGEFGQRQGGLNCVTLGKHHLLCVWRWKLIPLARESAQSLLWS